MSNSRATKGLRPDRGGIRKPGSDQRVDKDGDLNMAGGNNRRGRGNNNNRGNNNINNNRGGRHGRGRGGRQNGPRIPNEQEERLVQEVYQNNESGPRRGTGPQMLHVTGWKDSPRYGNEPDGGIQSLITWLDYKASMKGQYPDVHILKHRKINDNTLAIQVGSKDVLRYEHVNGFMFGGSTIKIEKPRRPGEADIPGTQEKSLTKAGLHKMFEDILSRRYDPTEKSLNLSELDQEPALNEIGYPSSSRLEPIFTTIMNMAGLVFPEKDRRDAVHGVYLAGNGLDNVEPVTLLATTFPNIKNLDLRNNHFKSMAALERWKVKFRDLERILIAGNDIDQLPETREKLKTWYPKLCWINEEQVRTAEDVVRKLNPIPVAAPRFNDQSEIAANFVRSFFEGFDKNRDQILQGFYDDRSTFSMSVNTSAPRVPTTDPPQWERYLRRSRNLLKINHLPARTSRLVTGVEAIRKEWAVFPTIRHPTFDFDRNKWLIECHPIPGIPAPIEGGVGGLLVVCHSAWEEIDDSTDRVRQTISFDRAFVLGPAEGGSGVRVVNDALCLRAFGGSEAWQVGTAMEPPGVTEGFGELRPGKPELQAQQEAIILLFSHRTRLTLPYAHECLLLNEWNVDKAFLNFEQLKQANKIGSDAFW